MKFCPTWLKLSLLLCLGSTAIAAAQPTPTLKYYLPNHQASKIVSVTRQGSPVNEIVVVTQAVAVKETGPAVTVKKFGEVYTFSPSFLSLRAGQPVAITFWNLQPDDDHDFALLDAKGNILMSVELPPLEKTSYIFTFHKAGLFDFKCLQHQPAMSGQILVLPAKWPA